MVMSYPLLQDASQVVLREGDHNVQAFPSERTHRPFAAPHSPAGFGPVLSAP